ncbi:MAG TPA: ComEA family DNA-binding protein [Nocardioidaceae bacterium]
MRSRRTAQDEMAAIARRRLELLGAELAELRDATPDGAAGAAEETSTGPEPDEIRPGVPEAPPESLPMGLADAPSVVPGRPGRPGRHARRPVGRAARTGAWVHDRLPSTLQGRVSLGAAHLTVVAVLVAAGLAVTSWWVLRADAEVTVVPARADALPSPAHPAEPALVTPAAHEAGPDPGEPAVVVVDVAGKVRRPGIATLPVGARVVDALEAAGGVRRGVDLTSLNLARLLVDGEQIVVGVPPPGGVAAPAASAPGGASSTGGPSGPLVNVNTATQAQLEELPGVGPVTAGAILQWRTEHGPFTAVDELMEVSGIGEATLAEIAPFVTL